jgi:hypothetical protein
MHLSKQEFSKLSKRDQEILSRGRNKQTTKKPKNPAKKKGKTNSSKQASVAAAYATRNVGTAPRVTATRDSCRIVHREFIGNITGSVAFNLSQSLAVNPGLAATFPWLSVTAQAWEQYKFHKLRFCFYTRTGSNTPGSVLLSPDYDASDAPPSSEQIMSSYDNTVEDAPWKDMCCVLKPQLMSGMAKRHFVRSAALAANQDIKLYDVADFYVGTVDGTAVSWGKLWVEYDIEFFIPQLPPLGIQASSGGSIVGGGALSAANPLGTVPVLDPESSGLGVSALSVITFQSSGTCTVSTTLTGTVITAQAIAPALGAVLVGTSSSVIDGGAVTALRTDSFTVVAGSTLTLSATATTITSSRCRIGFSPAGSQS